MGNLGDAGEAAGDNGHVIRSGMQSLFSQSRTSQSQRNSNPGILAIRRRVGREVFRCSLTAFGIRFVEYRFSQDGITRLVPRQFWWSVLGRLCASHVRGGRAGSRLRRGAVACLSGHAFTGSLLRQRAAHGASLEVYASCDGIGLLEGASCCGTGRTGTWSAVSAWRYAGPAVRRGV